jgi:zinc protease
MIAPPAPGPARSVEFPKPVEATLENGLRVIAIEQRNLPLIAAHLVLPCGGAADPPNLPGLATMTATLLTQGTSALDATQIAEEVDVLGARLDAAAGFDATTLSVLATTAKFRAALELAGQVVRDPAFAESDLERAKGKAQSDLKLTYSSPSSLARLVATRAVFGSGPYGHPLSGTPASVAAMTRADVLAFHKARFVPAGAVLAIGGDIDPAAAIELVRSVFGAWRAAGDAVVPVAASALPAPRFIVVDHAPAGRTAVVAAHPAIRRRDPEYYCGVVTTAILSGYSGRLNQEVRVKRGLSYGAGAQLIARRQGGLFVAATLVDHRKAVETVDVVLETLRGLEQRPPSANELATRKTNILGNFARSVETIEGLIGTFGEYALYGIGLDEIDRYQGAVEAVTPEQIVDFTRRFIAERPTVVLTGHAGDFVDDLKAFKDVERIAFDDLDLGSATLVRN